MAIDLHHFFLWYVFVILLKKQVGLLKKHLNVIVLMHTCRLRDY